jgi:very-short-patch-repair endonuclease
MLHALKRWGVKIRLAWDSRKFKINYANLTCKGCSKLFVRPPNLANALFCKDDCRREYESMHGTPLRKEKTKSNCAFCKKDLYLLPSKKRKTNFCNRTCKIAYTKSGQLPKTQKTVEIICLTCKKPKIIPQKTFERYETKYCSRNCYAKCGPTRTSKPHLAVRHFLEKYGIIFQEEVSVGDYWMDFTTNNKICIEVNGDYWHCNPKKYKSDYLNRKTKKTAAEIWEKDKERKEFIEKSGYKVIILWESDIMKNINSILETTLKEIMLHLNIEICANSIKEKIDKSHKSCNSKQEILN